MGQIWEGRQMGAEGGLRVWSYLLIASILSIRNQGGGESSEETGESMKCSPGKLI